MSIITEYEKHVQKIENYVMATGRRPWQEQAMKNIVPDIVDKLKIKDEDRVLDIGCNIGEITIPLSFICKEIVGIDAEGCIKRLKKRSEDIKNIKCIAGDFFEIDLQDRYDCILIYSVLPHMNSYEQALGMILKASSLLNEGGRLLIGDVTNADKRARMNMNATGKKVAEEYKAYAEANYSEEENIFMSSITKMQNQEFAFNDEIIMRLLIDIRKTGKEAYLLPQNEKLPFGYSREDILVKAW